MALFRDRTGRPGPATWEVGSFPEGQADFPVSGVSWHEAAAYAEFAGKSLPTLHHWFRAADSRDLLGPAALQQLRRAGTGPGGRATEPERLRHLRHGRQRPRVGVERVRRPALHARRRVERPDLPLHGPRRPRSPGPQPDPGRALRRLRGGAPGVGLRAAHPRVPRLLEGAPGRGRRLRRVPELLRLRSRRPRREARVDRRSPRALASREGELRRGLRRRAHPRPALPSAERHPAVPGRRVLPAQQREL